MPAVSELSVAGFRSFAKLDRLRLAARNILIGANGSGKSKFVEVFQFAQAVWKGRLEKYVARTGGADPLLHYGAGTTKRMSFRISFAEPGGTLELVLEPTDDQRLFVTAEGMSDLPWLRPDWDPNQSSDIVAPRAGDMGEDPGDQYLNSWRIYDFRGVGRGSALRQNSDLYDGETMHSDGSNLASFLYVLGRKHRKSYDRIRDSVRMVAPFFEDFDIRPFALDKRILRLRWRHTDSDRSFDVSEFSDGTLRFVALVTALAQPVELRPSTIVLDEPELGLHPFAINVLASLIQSASVHTQMVVSTQSALLIDSFEPEDVLVADRVDGATQLTRLKSSELAEWLQDYTLGELWQKNELGGRPAPERRKTPA